ncbi:MAG: RNA polymerase sigma factor [Phycisphaerae bacterium]
MRNSSRQDQPAVSLRQLALRAQRGDKLAFEQLHRRLEPGLKRVLLRRAGGQRELAEELAQKTWIAVWQALRNERYDAQKAAISTFVYAVAHKLWLQHLRRTRHAALSDGVFEALLEATPEGPENPAATLQAGELLEAMRACLHAIDTPFSLSEDERRLVIGLARGASERALAEQLSVAASTIHARKQLAYRKLRSCLAAKGFAPENVERRPVDGE